jgi:ketosteroid isomerase-like protein
MGWDAYSKAFQAQFARTRGTILDRTNSYIKVTGDSAWVTYQWRYAASVDGIPASALGHTTLALEKRNGAWLIVLNHTSVSATGSQQSASPAASPQPAGYSTSAPTGVSNGMPPAGTQR